MIRSLPVTYLSYLFFVLAVFSVGALLFPVAVHGQTAGVSISPATIEESVDPGDYKEYTVIIENLRNSSEVYYLSTRNIKAVRDGGVPVFAESNLERTGFELAEWVTLPYDTIELEAGERHALNFTVQVPDNASPGSHFGGVFISIEAPEIESSGASVGYQVANIISLRVSGDIDENASIRQFATDKFLHGSQDVTFSVRIENSGNVLVRPVGPLEIYNMLGKKIETILFNEEQSAVFPYDTRDFGNIVWEGDSLGFGRYEAVLSPSYGDSGAKKTMSSTVTFWILPMQIIGPALAVLAVLLLVVFVAVRVYVRRSLAHAGYGRRINSRRRGGGGSSTMLLLSVVMLTTVVLFLIALLVLFA